MSRGRFYLRSESNEWDFIAALEKPPFDAVVISDRYLPPYPEGHKYFGEPCDRLTKAVEGRGLHWSVDPDTARLEHPKSAERQRPHAANRPLAKALALPLGVDQLSDPDNSAALAEAASVQQLGSRAFAAPYLEVAGVEDPRLAVNLDLLEHSRELAGDRTLVAYLQILGSRLLDGSGAEVARALAAAGAEVIFVRVRRFEPELASPAELLAYADLIGAGSSNGTRVVGDCVGRLGPALIAVGADGFATNALRFRKVAEDLHPVGGGGGNGPGLMWEVPEGGAARSLTDPLAPVPCEVEDCPAPDGRSGSNAAIRIHNLHDLQRSGRLAAVEGLRYGQRLAKSSSPTVRGWASALQQLARRAA
jgi:hypothetical protein